jgi:hypothetical protein
LQNLEDLAGTPDKLDAVVSSFTGVFVKGGLSPKALKGFFEATGLNLRVELAKTFRVTPDEMSKLMGKKGLAPSQAGRKSSKKAKKRSEQPLPAAIFDLSGLRMTSGARQITSGSPSEARTLFPPSQGV